VLLIATLLLLMTRTVYVPAPESVALSWELVSAHVMVPPMDRTAKHTVREQPRRSHSTR
jgi:hypothetical protein